MINEEEFEEKTLKSNGYIIPFDFIRAELERRLNNVKIDILIYKTDEYTIKVKATYLNYIVIVPLDKKYVCDFDYSRYYDYISEIIIKDLSNKIFRGVIYEHKKYKH